MAMTEIQIITAPGMYGASSSDSFCDTMLREIATKSSANPDMEWAEKYGTVYENDIFLMCPNFIDTECNCGFSVLRDNFVESHHHTEQCYQSALEASKRELYAKFGVDYDNFDDVFDKISYEERTAGENLIYDDLCEQFNVDREYGCVMHCTCERKQLCEEFFAVNDHAFRCPHSLPNFWYKPTDFQITWYKFIGREVRGNQKVTLEQLIAIKNHCLKSVTDAKIKCLRKFKQITDLNREGCTT